MTENEEAQFLEDIARERSVFERLKKNSKQLFTSKSKIRGMRNQLIQEFKASFIEYTTITSSDPSHAQMIIIHFDDRINTLPTSHVIDLHEAFSKLKQMKTERGKFAVQNWIIKKIQWYYDLDGWYANEITKNTQKK